MPIRGATSVDLAAIDAIYNHYVQTSTSTFQVEPTTPEERRAWFAAHGPDHPVVVFEEDDDAAARLGGPRVADGRITGWASLNRYHPREAYRRTVELSVYVRHDRHRRGAGFAIRRQKQQQSCRPRLMSRRRRHAATASLGSPGALCYSPVR